MSIAPIATYCFGMTEAQTFLRWLYGPDGGNSAQRPHLVVAWANDLADDDGPLFWEVVTTAWSGFDLIPHKGFADLFHRFASSVPPCEVDQQVTVYRGQDADADKGLSWTRDRKVAEAFAHGHRGLKNPSPMIFEMKIEPEQIAFVCHDRDEAEVVLRRLPD